MKRTVLFLIIAAIACLQGCINEPEAPTLIVNGGTPGMKSDSLGVITAHSIEVFSVIANQNGAKVEECGFLIIREGTTDTLSIPVAVEIDKAPIYINATIGDLEPATHYIIYPYARNREGLGLGAELKARTKSGMPEVQTVIHSDSIKGRSAYLGLRLGEYGESPIIRIGILLADNTDMFDADTLSLSEAIPQANDSLVMQVRDLSMLTTYYVQAFAANVYGMYKGELLSFSTTDGSPVLGTLNVFDAVGTMASYSATIISAGDAGIMQKGVCWAEYPRVPIISDGAHVEESDTFGGRITGLTAEARYMARAYATNEFGTAYSEIVDFISQRDSLIVINDIYSITDGYAMIRANDLNRDALKSIGEIIGVGLCWATHPDPSIADNYREMEASTAAPFSDAITNLRGETTYYVRAFVHLHNGYIAYSRVRQFDTPSIFHQATIFPGSARLPYSLTTFTNGDGDRAYILGGGSGTDLSGQLRAYNASDVWENMAPFPDAPRKMQSAVMINNVGYVFGGVDNNDVPTNSLHRYMPNKDEWDKVRDEDVWPTAVHSVAGTQHYYMAYFIGGNRMGAVSNEVWEYHTLYPSWTRRTDFPIGMQNGIAVSISNTLYAGFGATNAAGTEYDRRLWSTTYTSGIWTQETTLPAAAGIIRAAVAFKRAIFMVDDTGTIWKYDVETKQWARKSQLPTSNRGDYQHCMFVLNNSIYIGFGISYKSLVKYSPSWDN